MSIYVGLDISKKTVDVCVLKSKEDRQSYKFDNNGKGHQSLLGLLAGLEVKLVIKCLILLKKHSTKCLSL